MSNFVAFLRALFDSGTIIHQVRPGENQPLEPAAWHLLERAFYTHRLTIPGAVLPFQREVAAAAAQSVWRASWFLLSHEEQDDQVRVQLQRLKTPSCPADHLSADLTLCYLPTLLRRARAHDPMATLTLQLTELLREWPFSGVLCDVADPPHRPLDFGHAGLQRIYAERFVDHPRQHWLPTGPGLDVIEQAWNDAGKDLALLKSWRFAVKHEVSG